MATCGDVSKFYNAGLEEQDFSTYVCPLCKDEKEVAENFDLFSKMFFPVSFKDTICVKCDEAMERKAAA
jgi:hypothetical protein